MWPEPVWGYHHVPKKLKARQRKRYRGFFRNLAMTYSHGRPTYHQRCIVSLLSSGWDQVVPMLYGRQEIGY